MEQKKNNKWIGKAAVVGLIVLGILAFRYFELGQYLSLDYIKSSQEKFPALYQSHRRGVIAAYMGIYIVVTALYKRKFTKARQNTPVEKKSTHGHWKGEAHV